MITAKSPPPTLVARPAVLKELAQTLLGEPILAVDTESNSLYAYQEQVCLVQFSTSQADFLVDPLALDDLSPLAPVFSNPQIEKVFHAAEYDLICLKRDFGFEFANIFDTMVASRILGRQECGLGAILQAEFNVKLNKRHQRANWGERPLPDDLLAYAQLDTHYLIELRQRLWAELNERGLLPLALEDFRRLCHVLDRNHEHQIDGCWRITGAFDLPLRNMAVLSELCRYRDQVARRLNRPLFKVFADRTLLNLASSCPTNMEQLERVASLSRLQIERHGRALLEVIKRGLSAEPPSLPRRPRPDERFLVRLDELRAWRKKVAARMGVGSDVVLPREYVFALAERNPKSAEELAQVLQVVPWRLEHFGAEILEVLRRCE